MENRKTKLSEEEESFDDRWEREFGPVEGTYVLSVDDFFKQLKRMMEFNC